MGFRTYSSPYDWGKVADYRNRARQVPGGLIDLSVGSPVDAVPRSVQEALSAAADKANAHGYPATAGTPELRTAIADWFLNCRDVDLDAIGAGIVPTVGSKEAVALMASLLHLGRGDVVVQPKISYPTYEIGTQLAGATVLKVDDIADVESWRHVPCVKAIWVNSPCNPTGEVLSAAQLTSIVAAARAMGAVVLSDECYALMSWLPGDVLDEKATCPAVEVGGSVDVPAVPPAVPSALGFGICGGRAQGVLALYSLSKQSNMAGYRAAFIAGDRDLIEQMTQYRKQMGQIIAGPVQAAMVAALRDTGAVHDQWMRYWHRLVSLVSGLRRCGYRAVVPYGALYVWTAAQTGDCWSDLDGLARLGILASPGEFYGDRGHLRFSVTASDEDIGRAVERLSAGPLPQA
ncbi:MAG: succinyldiaminopimelate transaminase [Bifidobacterium sp.]|jgi:succinyldiaminopimelate transaminase|nr:succinyldiaminopimelate transaminase [Bifidobacterium sp.]MCI1864792.1 succinyldiaminopimelate transaminase [Bifidobacterium sp.]